MSDQQHEMDQQKKPVLACRQLSKIFSDGELHVEVLKQLNFQVMSGDMIAIIGASGAGKSTLLHCLGGLDRLSGGTVELMQQPFSTMPESQRCQLRNQYLGFVYQFHHLLPEFNTLENIAMPLLIAGKSISFAQDIAMSWLKKVGLANRCRHRVGELSGGERQRIAIARALVANPKCVLADEPTGNLDEKTAAGVFDLMLELNDAHCTSFVVVTHNKKLAHKMQTIYELRASQLVKVAGPFKE